MKFFSRIAPLLSLLLPFSAIHLGAAEPQPKSAGSLLICGMDEVFAVQVDAVEKGRLEKVWSWRAKDHEEIPEDLRKTFATTDDCKPIEGGRKVLITSSSGGCALVERPSGRVLWHARVANAHSIELLPNDRVAVAASVSKNGDRLVVFDLSKSVEPLYETPLPSAHGVVWDGARNCLWALGFSELQRYELTAWDSAKPTLTLKASHTLPDEGGHDLQAVPGSADLVLTTHDHVYLFNRDKPAFALHPELANKANVKCVSTHPTSGRVVFIHGDGTVWWSDTLGFLAPAAQAKVGKEKMYKARWLPDTNEARDAKNSVKTPPAMP